MEPMTSSARKACRTDRAPPRASSSSSCRSVSGGGRGARARGCRRGPGSARAARLFRGFLPGFCFTAIAPATFAPASRSPAAPILPRATMSALSCRRAGTSIPRSPDRLPGDADAHGPDRNRARLRAAGRIHGHASSRHEGATTAPEGKAPCRTAAAPQKHSSGMNRSLSSRRRSWAARNPGHRRKYSADLCAPGGMSWHIGDRDGHDGHRC